MAGLKRGVARVFRKRLLAACIAVCAVFLVHGCTFVRISLRNVPALFRTPTTVHKLNRSDVPVAARLCATWIGHATVLVQMDDVMVMTDPVLTDTIGGFSKRLIEPGMDIEKVPRLDAVLISHRHLDHLSPESLEMLGPRIRTVVTPPGVKADLAKQAFSIQELAAWQTADFNGLKITAVPVIHDGGRALWDAASHSKSYTGYLLQYHGMSVYFPGDTAYQENIFSDVFRRFGAVDLALMPICPIAPEGMMLGHHMNPTEAIDASKLLHAATMVPIHFETFINSLDAKDSCREALQKAANVTSAPPEVLLWQVGESVILR